jgi:hypothetical protein
MNEPSLASSALHFGQWNEYPSTALRYSLTPPEQKALQRIALALFALTALLVLWGIRRGLPGERAMAYVLLLFALFLTNLYPWYLIPVFALLVLHSDRLGLVYIAVQTLLALAYYPFYVYAHHGTTWPPLHIHLFLAIFLTLPVVAFLLADSLKRIPLRRPRLASDGRS